ncbi:MAG: 5'/3'-nucleotidase SurE [Pseudonocardia sp.]|nr:5'/3'-nucleotidase SurE [Pseudonocardia sp.]
MSTPPRVLITNDDGIDSPGLHILARGARDAGFDVVVAAPHVNASGVGASVLSVSRENRTAVHPRTIPGLDGIPAFAVEAHPAFIVHAARRGWLDPLPDLVLSGINLGSNVGHAVIHSGTVGAILTGALHGLSGLAVSLDTGVEEPAAPHWESVLHVLPEVLDLLTSTPAGTLLSLNVPDRPVAGLGPLREAALSMFGAVQARVDHTPGVDDGPGTLLTTISDPDGEFIPGSDLELLAQGHPTLSRLTMVESVPGILPQRSVTSSS